MLPMAQAELPRLRRVFGEQLADSVRKPLPALTPRRVFGRVRFPGKVTVVTGMRRAGKTTFLHQLRGERLAEGAPRERLPYVSFEDERLADLDATHLGLLLSEYDRRFPDADDGAPVTWHFDEIQVVPGWERFVRRLLDAERTEVLITGSSAALLSREIATALRGRAWQVPMHPFGFDEALRHQGRGRPDDPAALTGRERARLERSLLDWLDAGGFPRRRGWTRPRDTSSFATTSTWRYCATSSNATLCATSPACAGSCGICWATRVVCSASRSSGRR